MRRAMENLRCGKGCKVTGYVKLKAGDTITTINYEGGSGDCHGGNGIGVSVNRYRSGL